MYTDAIIWIRNGMQLARQFIWHKVSSSLFGIITSQSCKWCIHFIDGNDVSCVIESLSSCSGSWKQPIPLTDIDTVWYCMYIYIYMHRNNKKDMMISACPKVDLSPWPPVVYKQFMLVSVAFMKGFWRVAFFPSKQDERIEGRERTCFPHDLVERSQSREFDRFYFDACTNILVVFACFKVFMSNSMSLRWTRPMSWWDLGQLPVPWQQPMPSDLTRGAGASQDTKVLRMRHG